MAEKISLYNQKHDIIEVCPQQDEYYSSDQPVDCNAVYMQVNRAGIMLSVPKRFIVSQDDSYRYCQIVSVIHGYGNLSFRGHIYEIYAGSVFVLPSNEGHFYSSDYRNPLGLVWVEYAGGNSAQITDYIVNMGGPIYNGRTFEDVMNLCTSILYQPTREGPGISAKIYEILMRLCKDAEKASNGRVINHDILKYIDENISGRLALTDIAQVFGYNPAYFSSCFSKTMGVSFSKYVMNRRISHVCYLLETTDWPLESIAREMGFSGISHLIQRFRAVKQTTPMAYRFKSPLYQKRRAMRRGQEQKTS